MMRTWETTAMYLDGYDELGSFDSLEEAIAWCKDYQKDEGIDFVFCAAADDGHVVGYEWYAEV